MKDFLKENFSNLIIVIMYLIEIPTCAIVLWETFTNKSIVDVIWNFFERRKPKEEESNEES